MRSPELDRLILTELRHALRLSNAHRRRCPCGCGRTFKLTRSDRYFATPACGRRMHYLAFRIDRLLGVQPAIARRA